LSLVIVCNATRTLLKCLLPAWLEWLAHLAFRQMRSCRGRCCADGLQGDLKIEAKGARQLRNEPRVLGKTMVGLFNEGKGRRVADGKGGDLPIWVTAYASLDIIPALSRLQDSEVPT